MKTWNWLPNLYLFSDEMRNRLYFFILVVKCDSRTHYIELEYHNIVSVLIEIFYEVQGFFSGSVHEFCCVRQLTDCNCIRLYLFITDGETTGNIQWVLPGNLMWATWCEEKGLGYKQRCQVKYRKPNLAWISGQRRIFFKLSMYACGPKT